MVNNSTKKRNWTFDACLLALLYLYKYQKMNPVANLMTISYLCRWIKIIFQAWDQQPYTNNTFLQIINRLHWMVTVLILRWSPETDNLKGYFGLLHYVQQLGKTKRLDVLCLTLVFVDYLMFGKFKNWK